MSVSLSLSFSLDARRAQSTQYKKRHVCINKQNDTVNHADNMMPCYHHSKKAMIST